MITTDPSHNEKDALRDGSCKRDWLTLAAGAVVCAGGICAGILFSNENGAGASRGTNDSRVLAVMPHPGVDSPGGSLTLRDASGQGIANSAVISGAEGQDPAKNGSGDGPAVASGRQSSAGADISNFRGLASSFADTVRRYIRFGHSGAPVIVRIDSRISLAAAPVSIEELERELKAYKAANPRFSVIVRSDAAASYQDIMDVLDAVGRVGITQVGLSTRPRG